MGSKWLNVRPSLRRREGGRGGRGGREEGKERRQEGGGKEGGDASAGVRTPGPQRTCTASVS